MAIVDLVMPKMGESIMEATVLKWHKQPGDNVKMDETLLDIATDKVDSEVPSTVAGVITELLYKENDVVPVGAIIAKIETGGAVTAAPAPAPVQQALTAITAGSAATAVSAIPGCSRQRQKNSGSRFYSPLVLNIAGTEGIGMAELENIPGTGNEGRVTKKDILSYVANRGNVAVQQQSNACTGSAISFRPLPAPALQLSAPAPCLQHSANRW